jgi:hypothetical protein
MGNYSVNPEDDLLVSGNFSEFELGIIARKVHD